MMNKPENGLGELIKRGGIYYSVPGKSVQEVLESLAAKIPALKTISKEDLLKAMLEREALMSTGIGRGIAVPHPRNPLVQPEEQFAALAFLENPVDWKALDGKAVETLFVIVSASAKLHLQSLSAITYFCQQEAFQKLLKEKAPQEKLVCYINEAEENWIQ
jgi:PTS system nitrogen regulatory IIA component